MCLERGGGDKPGKHGNENNAAEGGSHDTSYPYATGQPSPPQEWQRIVCQDLSH